MAILIVQGLAAAAGQPLRGEHQFQDAGDVEIELVERRFRVGIEHLARTPFRFNQFDVVQRGILAYHSVGFHQQIALEIVKVHGALQENPGRRSRGRYRYRTHDGIKEIRIVRHTVIVTVAIAHQHLEIIHVAVTFHRLAYDGHGDVGSQAGSTVRLGVYGQHIHEVSYHGAGSAVIDGLIFVEKEPGLQHRSKRIGQAAEGYGVVLILHHELDHPRSVEILSRRVARILLAPGSVRIEILLRDQVP